ncbi:MAG: SRPBCC domain-containing protein [Bacteroidia bacterium]|nr:SRPBCC domain-containing protein [Bacteroidia bacterium]
MTTATAHAQIGKATTVKNTFNQVTSVSINIDADSSIIWTLLTNASDFPRWNSTVVSIEGDIKLGEKIKLKSTLDESRTFKIKIKEMEAEHRMVWGDGKGSREFTLTPKDGGGYTFSMVEKIGGLMFPMYAKYLPSFIENFEQYALDLKTEAEVIERSGN